MRPEQPPEHWLVKAHDGDVLVDLIFSPAGGAVTDEHFARAIDAEVMAQRLRVASVDDVLATKLLALSEQEPDFRDVLAIARALREQIDWEFVEERASSSPFARAFFVLADGLGIRPVASSARRFLRRSRVLKTPPRVASGAAGLQDYEVDTRAAVSGNAAAGRFG